MGTFILIVIIAFVVFIIVQLTDTSTPEVFNFKYRGKSFLGSSGIGLIFNQSEISIKEKFITIKRENAPYVKMRILDRLINPYCIKYICMDGYRNKRIVIRYKYNRISDSKFLDEICVQDDYTIEIYTNNPNLENDIKNAETIMDFLG